jgi:hypothetical protein
MFAVAIEPSGYAERVDVAAGEFTGRVRRGASISFPVAASSAYSAFRLRSCSRTEWARSQVSAGPTKSHYDRRTARSSGSANGEH